MKLSLDTLNVLSEGGCEQVKDAMSEWFTLHLFAHETAKVEYTYNAVNGDFNVDLAFKYQPAYKHTIMGMPAVKV